MGQGNRETFMPCLAASVEEGRLREGNCGESPSLITGDYFMAEVFLSLPCGSEDRMRVRKLLPGSGIHCRELSYTWASSEQRSGTPVSGVVWTTSRAHSAEISHRPHIEEITGKE